jgi:hypothetical protein
MTKAYNNWVPEERRKKVRQKVHRGLQGGAVMLLNTVVETRK